MWHSARPVVASLLLGFLGLSLVTTTSAVPIDGALRWTGAGTLTGILSADPDQVTALAQRVPVGVYPKGPSWTITSNYLILDIYERDESRTHLYLGGANPLGQGQWRHETYEYFDSTLHVTIIPPEKLDAQAALWSETGDGTRFDIQADALTSAKVRSVVPEGSLVAVPHSSSPYSHGTAYEQSLPEGRQLELTGRLDVVAQGPLRGAFFGWELEVVTEDGSSTRFQTGVQNVRDPTTGLPVGKHLEYALLRAVGANLEAPSNGAALTFYTPLLSYTGFGLFPGGSYAGESEDHAPKSEKALPLGGSIWLSASEEDDPRNTARTWGDADWAMVARQAEFVVPVGSGTPAWALLAASTGLLAGAHVLPQVARSLLHGSFALYARLTDKDVESNPTRNRIARLVRERPGLNLSGIVRELGVGWGTVAYHIQILKREGRVKELRFLNRACFFPTHEGEEKQMQTVLMHQPNYREVMSVLVHQPGLSQREIASRTAHARQYISRLVSKMERAGLVRTEASPSGRRYFPLNGASPTGHGGNGHAQNGNGYELTTVAAHGPAPT